ESGGGGHDVRVLRGPEEARLQLVELVRHDAVIHHHVAARLDNAAQGESIGVVDLPRLAGRSRLGDLVARREHGHARLLSDVDLSQAEGGRYPDLLGPQDAPRGEHDLAGTDVFAAQTPIRSRRDGAYRDARPLA